MSQADVKTGPKKRWLYGPIIGFVLLVALYAAYWFYAIGKIEQRLDQWIAEQRAQGVEIDYAARAFGGFPYRFMVRLDAPTYRDGASKWSGETLEVFLQPWNLRHALVRTPGRNEIDLQGLAGTALLDAGSAASFRWNGDGLTDFGLTLKLAEFVSGQADVSVRGLTGNYRLRDDTVRLGLDWEAVSVSEDLIAGQDWAFLGPDLQASRLRVELVGLTDPALASNVRDRSVNLAQLRLNWGPLKLGVKGDVDITPTGHLDGPIHVRLDEADALSEAMAQRGRFPSQITLIVEAIGAASEDGAFFTLPIRDGAVNILGFPVAAIPPIAPALPASGADAPAQ